MEKADLRLIKQKMIVEWLKPLLFMKRQLIVRQIEGESKLSLEDITGMDI